MKFSVITACLNSERTIAETLRSVALQTHGDVEHIIVDGGSTDGTLAIVAKFPHVARVVSGPDTGIYDAMNKGLRLATGDVIGFLNSDDFFCSKDALSLMERALEQTGADVVTAGVAIVDKDDLRRVRRHYSVKRYSRWMLRMGHMPPHPTLYIKVDIFRRAGEFDERYRIAGDFDLSVRVLLGMKAKMCKISDTLVGFRIGGISTKDIGATALINAEILGSLRKNHVRSNLALLYSRYLFKSLQFLGGPRDYQGPIES